MVEGRKVGGSGEAFLLPSSSTNLSCLRGEIKFGKVGASLPFPNLYFHVNKLCWVGKVSYCTHIHNGPDDLITFILLGFSFIRAGVCCGQVSWSGMRARLTLNTWTRIRPYIPYE